MLVHRGHASAKKFFTSGTAASYDRVVRLTTFGRDAAWKEHILGIVSDRRGSVLDLACGTGILSSMLHDRGWQVSGLDLSPEYLKIAGTKMEQAFAEGTAEVLPYRDATFDAVVSSYLAKYVDVAMVAEECRRVLRPGGVAVFHDFACPQGIMRRLWHAYFTVLRGAGVLVPSWKHVFGDLDGVICESRWQEQAVQAMEESGFVHVRSSSQTLGTSATVGGQKP
ncbi:class I SAM-dependent methyltransferase [Candidatus Nitrososphaera sp. FF02]|uniref:class I SAM-dependent methyltransferase n=1 Tax=Candidatus Nitrososphaera sp. FF02 TaxID=3398226 RepID=UPI0039ED100C